MELVRDDLIVPACAELRFELGLPSPDAHPLGERELEAFWALHGKVFYLAIRRYIYGVPVPSDVSTVIVDDVRVFMRGMPDLMRECCAGWEKTT